MPRPPTRDISAILERAFAEVERAAVEGRRCPENDTANVPNNAVPALARAGRIRIEIYAHNYRVVTLLTGAHRGMKTAPPAAHLAPWKVIDRDGTHTIRGSVGRETRPQPSAPRPLTREELKR